MLFLLLLLAAPLGAQRLHEVCGACHSEPASDFQAHAHFSKGLSCDACHGESKAHRDATGHIPVDRVAAPAGQPAVCGACHGGQKKEYEASKHWTLLLARSKTRAPACTTCHGTHAARSPAAIKVQCQRCHAALPAACGRDASCASCHGKHAIAARN